MSERRDLLVSIANEIRTYREGEIAQPTPEHVDRWASQFTPANQLAFLREFNHVIKQTFITRDVFSDFLSNLVTNVQLAGNDPRPYWARANVLDIQIDGSSQKEMIGIFGDALRNKLGLTLSQCGADGGDYIYFDDVIFSGGRVGTDLQSWITNSAPANATVHVVVIAYHLLGQYYANNRITEAARAANKNIRIRYWRVAEIENRKYQKDNSAVLWPVAIPNDAASQAYQAHLVAENKFPLVPRTAGGTLNMFSSEAGRQILESEFLIAGVKIRSRMGNLSEWYRPLGCSSFGVGFGSLFTTYRNCPNNCPLALWWGNSDGEAGNLRWYPLLQRKTYASAENVFG